MLKHTPEDNPDKTTLPQVVSVIREILGRVNTASGQAENRFNLIQLDGQLQWRPGEEVVSPTIQERKYLLTFRSLFA